MEKDRNDVWLIGTVRSVYKNPSDGPGTFRVTIATDGCVGKYGGSNYPVMVFYEKRPEDLPSVGTHVMCHGRTQIEKTEGRERMKYNHLIVGDQIERAMRPLSEYLDDIPLYGAHPSDQNAVLAVGRLTRLFNVNDYITLASITSHLPDGKYLASFTCSYRQANAVKDLPLNTRIAILGILQTYPYNENDGEYHTILAAKDIEILEIPETVAR